MYVMMTMVTVGGLMLVAQIDPFSEDVGVKNVPLSLGFATIQVLSLATMMERILGGATRPLFGWISDRVGREPTMFFAFGMEGLSILLLLNFAHDPVLFIVFVGMTFFFWGEIYSLFPATVGDTFGRKYATTNYALMYTAKGTAALVVPFANSLKAQTGSWTGIFALSITFAWATALLALFALRPLRRRFIDEMSRT
jgi:OFA family oxalate/formate antiporter-like MFS transporter